MWLSASRHSICRSPPGRETVQLRSARPVRMAATVSAHAPVPHASVGPAPRSQTTILRWERLSTCTNSVLVFAGKTGWASKRGPTAARSSASRSSTNVIACGLPIPTQVMSHSFPATSSGASIARPSPSVGSVVGTSAACSRGSPMSTTTVPSARSSGLIRPARVEIVIVPCASGSRSPMNRAMQRMPLPHISGSEPSEL
mmetsp:Transcript_54722/g.143861  ORF Transcript_54722/g.143861 Transcript_54722/m.143861 type:complete len:200 (-) Transcript_54722:301-900(-)